MRRMALRRTAPSVQLLLDEYPNATVAYSLRDLSTAFVGSPVVRVRRSTDNAEQDFTSTEVTDGTLTTFTGANNGFVTTWYDQSGNGQDVSQATATAQPKIVISGVLNLYNNKPSILVDGNQVLLANVSSKTNLAFAHNSSASVSYVANLSNGIWFGTSSAAFGNDNLTGFEIGYSIQNSELAIRNNNTKRIRADINNTEFFSGGIYYSQWNVLENDVNLSSDNFKNNTSLTQSKFVSSTLPVVSPSSSNDLAFFGKFFGTTNPLGDFSEMILWEGLQTSNREGITSQTNEYYSIY